MFSDWTLWSLCTSTCGSGSRTRYRSCVYGVFGDDGCDDGELTQEEECILGVSLLIQYFNRKSFDDLRVIDGVKR